MNFLLFQIYAPMVSWGEIAVGGERQSSRHPSKSAIIGLIAAALGIKRDEEERLSVLGNALGIAVKLYSGGSVLKDYHTIQVPRKEAKVVHYTRRSELFTSSDKIGTILSNREYRCDSLSVAALYLKDDSYSLHEIEKVLKKPFFHLYFGRKSAVPALPLAPNCIEASTLKEAFDQYKVSFVVPIDEKKPEWLKKIFEQFPAKTLFDSSITYFWEDGIESGFDALHSVERYDFPASRKRWQFSSRRENMAIIKPAEASNVPQ